MWFNNMRKLGVVSPILIGALVLASCGSDTGSASTSGYSGFYPGLKIVIPAKADC